MQAQVSTEIILSETMEVLSLQVGQCHQILQNMNIPVELCEGPCNLEWISQWTSCTEFLELLRASQSSCRSVMAALENSC